MARRRRQVRVLCTLGPASLDRQTISRLQEREVDLFRINLSHTPLELVEPTIRTIREHADTPICLDTEGAQARTGTMEVGVTVADRQRVRLVRAPVVGNAERLTITPTSVFDELRPNHFVGLDFDGVVLEVIATDDDGCDAVVLNGGKIGSNKAAVIDPAPALPPLSEKDRAAVALGMELGIRHVALSFANRAEDVAALRALTGPDVTIISKIESIRGVRNLDAILAETDEILIDRGDLSREVALESISFLQKAIINKANTANVPVNVATNLLESMLVNRKPTRAEINDIVNTLLDGATGLVLAAETAIGSHPILAVDMVLSLIERYRRSLDGHRIEDLLVNEPLLLPPYHGSSRYESAAPKGAAWASEGFDDALPAIEVDVETAMDIEQIAHRVYSPLTGFMTQAELEGVLDDYRLPGGAVWTLPILLQGTEDAFAAYGPGQKVRLVDGRTGEATAVLDITDKYAVDLDGVAARWFGTADEAHPGVARFKSRGAVMLGGPIRFLGPASVPRSTYALTPAQTRKVFDIKGWTKIVGFHTRNVPHTGHEHVIAHACERANADGILIHPVVGPKRDGDFLPEMILGAYERLVSEAHDNALLAAFSTYSRYSGPREAVFTALCRKNYGCTHFVLGRDHTGVGDFYPRGGNAALFERLGNIGVVPVFFDTVAYDPAASATVEAGEGGAADLRAISGTLIRRLLSSGEPIPAWIMRPSIARFLEATRDAGQPLFVGD